MKTRVLFIDNFDSFTYNLVDDFERLNCKTIVLRSDVTRDAMISLTQSFRPELIVISPGPGKPCDAGLSIDAVDYFKGSVPIFGVCLGHQVIIEYFGGQVGKASRVMHGKSSRVTHDGRELFEGVENPLTVGRYHSLAALDLPGALEITARSEDTVMAIRHRELEIYGVQFHPESILSPSGLNIIENILRIAKNSGQKLAHLL